MNKEELKLRASDLRLQGSMMNPKKEDSLSIYKPILKHFPTLSVANLCYNQISEINMIKDGDLFFFSLKKVQM